jgi:TatD DNase family protein
MMYQDAHLHLQECDRDGIDAFLKAARAKSIIRFFCNGTSPDDWQAVQNMSDYDKGITPFYGVHPWFTLTAGAGWEQELVRRLVENERAKVGEIGLDTAHGASDLEQQAALLASQIQIASDHRRPFVLHCVGAWSRLIDVLKKSKAPELPFMVHRFGGSKETAQELIGLGAYISFTLTERDVQKAARAPILTHIPDERLLIETDYPAVPPPADKTSSYPDIVLAAYTYAAEIKKIDAQRLQEIVWENGKIFAD